MTSRRTVGRLSRILSLIPYVLSRSGVEVKEILERFDYTEAELIRDLNTLFVCGLPGYGPGDLMEAFIDDNEVVIDAADYFARAPRLTPAEALGLLAAGLTITGSGQGSPELASAVKKLSRVVMGDGGDAISIEVGPGIETLDRLRDAAADQKVVRIRYRSLSKETETERDIEPWSVFTTLGNWYVQGHCRLVDAERVFRVDRIRSMETLDDPFRAPGWDHDGPWSPTRRPTTTSCARSPLAPRHGGSSSTTRWRSSPKTRGRRSSASPPRRLRSRPASCSGSGRAARLVEGDEVRKAVQEMGRSLLKKYR